MKKYIFFVIAALTLMTTACSSGDDKIDAKKDAEDMTKELVGIIEKTDVKDFKALDSLAMKVDSIETMVFQMYSENKKDENGNSLVDSLKLYYNQEGKAKVFKALEAKKESLKKSMKEEPKAPVEPKAPADTKTPADSKDNNAKLQKNK